jgi:hypothetical protein
MGSTILTFLHLRIFQRCGLSVQIHTFIVTEDERLQPIKVDILLGSSDYRFYSCLFIRSNDMSAQGAVRQRASQLTARAHEAIVDPL